MRKNIIIFLTLITIAAVLTFFIGHVTRNWHSVTLSYLSDSCTETQPHKCEQNITADAHNNELNITRAGRIKTLPLDDYSQLLKALDNKAFHAQMKQPEKCTSETDNHIILSVGYLDGIERIRFVGCNNEPEFTDAVNQLEKALANH